MSIQDLGAIGELIAALATVGTLLYLAIQIRQNSRTIENTAELECLKLLTDWVGRVSDNPEKQRLWDLSADPSQTMSAEDSRQFIWMMGGFGWVAQTAFIQYQRGFLSRQAWSEFERILIGMLQNGIACEWWENRETPYSAEFVGYIDRVRGAGSNWRPVAAARNGTPGDA